MNFGVINIQPCVNVLPPVDQRCSDPAFALENPTICPQSPSLIIKPAFALTCELGSVQYHAFKVTGGVEVDVTTDSTFVSSDPNTAVVGVDSGNATGLMPGEVTISATYQGMSAQSSMSILAGTDCCRQQHVALMVVVDVTKSMSLVFDATYSTRLAYAKAAATRFITEIDGTKDSVGLMTFSDSAQTLLASPTGDTGAVAALVPGIAQTQDITSFHDAIELAISELNATSADRKVIFIISDGEDTATTDTPTNNPFTLLSNFKAAGGIVMCLGVRASVIDNGFYRMSLFSSGGFFVNAYPATEDVALDYISGLKGYICAGNCTPAGDVMTNQGALNYNSFTNWNVVGGNVDLIGNGFLDLLPGNGLYVDMGGSTPTYNGTLESNTTYHLTSGHTYTITVWVAGNQQNDPNDLVMKLQVLFGAQTILSQTISVTGSDQDFHPYSFSWTAAADMDVTITLQQQLAQGYVSVTDPRWGLLLNEVKLVDSTDIITMLDDTFDDENPVYVPPGCGVGTTYVWIASLGQYGYETGTNCYGGYGCLSEPPGIQLPDPNALSDVESGGSPPAQQFVSTKTACATCPAGTLNLSNVTLVPTMTSANTPSGVAAASSAGVSAQPWMAFDGNLNRTGSPITNWQSAQVGDPSGQWLYYKFAAAVAVHDYEIFTPAPSLVATLPTDFAFEASNNGSTWTLLDSQTGVPWLQTDVSRRFSTANTTAYLYYRIRVLKTGNYPGYVEPRVIINELRLYGAGQQQVCATASYTSTISQADADSHAYASALASAQAQLECSTLYTSTQQYTAHCPVGTFGADVTSSATATSYISQDDADQQALALAQAEATAALDCGQSNNATEITINDSNSPPTAASPYPTVKFVQGLTGHITKVTVTVTGLAHTWPSDVHLLLRGPDGTTCALMRQAGNNLAILNVDLVFDDAAGSSLPQLTIITSGTYKPTQYGIAVQFPAPAPTLPYGSTLAVFNGKTPNGAYSLWTIDNLPFNSGLIVGGWDLTITTA